MTALAYHPTTATIPEAPRRAVARRLRVGLLGLGNVGSAIARLFVETRGRLARHGVELIVEGALVRDVHRRRACELDADRLTSDSHAFFAREYDVVIEVLGGVEPARTLVAQALRSGVPVVTANKALIAQHGEALTELARRHGVELRCESAVLAGVPFLTGLARRPLSSRVSRIVGVLNGTSNYVLSTAERTGSTIEAALAEAGRRGYAEPDAASDLNGLDAAAKLVVLLHHVGVSGVVPADIERTSIESVTPEQFADAAELGGTIKPVGYVRIGQRLVEAFVGPAWTPVRHPLAGLHGVSNGICLSGPEIGDLFHSGPGAGPEVTAATVIDDVVEVATMQPVSTFDEPQERDERRECVAPHTSWFVQVEFASVAPDPCALCDLLGSYGVWFKQLTSPRVVDGVTRFCGLTQPCSREAIAGALAALHRAAGGKSTPIRALEDADVCGE